VSDAPVSLDLGANALGIANLTLLRSPALRVSYRDATGAAVQEHVVTAEGYFVQQTIRDAQSIPVVTTKPAPGGFGSGASYPVPAFRPGFVEVADFLSELDASGAMRGDVSDWYDGTNDTDDGGYPYRRVAFERSPLRRAVEYGLPGAAYAIVNRSTTSPVERATVQCSYGPNTATSVPYLDLPPQSYGVATTVTPSKLPTSTISDASDADIARLTPNLGASFLSSASNSYENGDQTRVTAQPNSFVLDEPGEAETRRSNALRQLNYQCSPDAGESRYLYDRAGRVRFVQDARGAVDGIVVYLLWDALGRKVARGIVTFDWSAATEAELQEHAEDCAWPESSSVVTYQRQRGWAWDGDGSDPNAVGHMVGDLAVTGETEVAQRLCWNAAGLLEEKRVTISDPAARAEYATSFGYDVQGRLLTVGYPQLPGLGFAAVHYRYDGRDNVLSIRDDQGTSFAEYGYDPAGKAVSVDYRCGLIAGTQQHDPLGRQTTLALRAADGALTSSLGYNADGYLSGRVETLTPPLTGFDGNEVFRYDTLGRLESSTDTAGVKSIALSFKTPSGVIDQNGNLQSITRHAGASLSLDYVPGTNRVAGQAAGQRAGGASSAYAYYANGALRQRGSDLALSYVPGGLLPSTITAAGVELAFAYDSDGERVGKRVNGGPLTADVHAGFLGPIVIDSGGAAQALVYGPRGVVALASGGERYCVWSDHLGSPRVAWDGNGRVVAAYAYDAYGARVAANEPKAGFMPLGFTGRQLDHETGLYNFRTRLYDPVTGRFLAPDPAAQFPSAYCYAGNVPTMMTDPDGQMTAGLEALLDFGLLVLMIVGVAFTGGATTAVAAPLLELGTTIGTAQAVAAGMAIGAVGMGVSSAAFEGLYYGLTTPPGNWQWSRFGKDVAAAAIGGAVGGVVTGGLNVWVDWLTPLVTAPEAGEDIEMDVMGGVENAADAGADEPAPAQTTAQRAALLATRTVARGAAGAAGGALKGYVHKGMSNVFDNQDFNANVGESVLTGFGLGFAFGALGGGLSAAKDLDMIDMSGLTSAFSRTPQMFVMFGLMIGVSLYMVLYRRSATIQPSHSGGTT
jgi:RHS repeat-associated protein